MFKHQLKILLRNLRRYKSYSFINIFGLAVSFAVVILIALFIRNELSFDHGNEHLDRMYTVMMGGERGQQHIISAAALELSENIPEIDKYTRLSLRNDYALLNRGTGESADRSIMIKGLRYAWVDPEMFEVFTYEFNIGDPSMVLDEPYSIVLTESVADRLFGQENPVGQVLALNNKYDLTVTGVVKKPKNSHLDLDVFASILTLRSIYGPDGDRGYEYNSEPTYVLLPEEHDLEAVNKKIDAHMAAVFERVERERDEFSLFPVKNLYFSDIHYRGNHGSRMLLWILITIATLISLIAAINFINLSTARASIRAGEIGIKKVIGVLRKNLVRQLLGESLFMALAALVLAVVFAGLAMPLLNRVFHLGLTWKNLFNPLLLVCLVGGAGAIGFLSGLYPAFYLSAFPPLVNIKGEITRGKKGAFFRKALIVFQFSVAVILLVGTFTVTSQIRFTKNRDLGFNSENVFVFAQPRLASFRDQREVVKAELLGHPDILEVSFSQGYPGFPMNNESFKVGEEYIGFTHYSVDSDFIDVYGLRLLEGRFLDLQRSSDHLRAVVINETAVREFGLESPVGTHLPYKTRGNLTAFPVEEIEIVGVVEDFHCRSLHFAINPILISYNPDWITYGGVRYSGQNLTEVVAHARDVWKRFAPGFPFEYSFLDEEIQDMYSRDRIFEKVFFYAAGFSILIVCLGLFGLASFVAERRTKEIGIRKVLGASLSQILLLLSREFTLAILLANVIAWPVAYYWMNTWLENFVYRIDVGITTLILSAAIALAIALLTVCWQSLKAATADPVDALRYE
jgi:putative ABC transport system permease protein